ncbi:MAG: hypothetical protein ACOWWH_09030 [Eubacteriaceae bacterium]
MNEIFKAKETIKYAFFATITPIAFFNILSKGIDSNISINVIVGSIIILLLQMQRMTKIVRLTISDDKILEKKDKYFFVITIVLLVVYLYLERSLLGIYFLFYIILFISYMILLSVNNVSLILFLASLIPFVGIILSTNIYNIYGFILGSIIVLFCEMISFLKVRKLVIERKEIS